MPVTIAILGATGKTGREVLKLLLLRQDVSLQLYVRSRSKLHSFFPLLEADPRVSIFQGPLHDVGNMSQCLKGAEKIVFALGENDNLPNLTVIEDGAKTVLAALSSLRESSGHWERPRLLMLSSATWNPVLSATRPRLVHWAIKTAFCYAYADLVRGQDLFLEAFDLVNLLLVQPNGLVEDEASGHIIDTKYATLSVTYVDLGAGFVDLACSSEYNHLSAVGVSSRDGDNGLKYGPVLGYTILRGLCSTYIPGFWTMNKFVNSISFSLSSKVKTN
ncbi:hypothetical protein RBB50_008772 [Rhinocladiella similis]